MTIKKPSPYVPSFLRAALEGNRPLQLTFSDVKDSNILSTSSFMYDPADAPLKSTQQLNVDWSLFENHTFFMSAEAKVNIAFDQIINGYPFDGTRSEVEAFFEKLSGFDRWVFDQFPKYHGQLHLSGTQLGETSTTAGSYIVIKDAAGSLYPELSKTKTGESVLNPGLDSLSIEMQLALPTISTLGTQVICQKLSGSTHGFSLYVMPTASTSSAEVRFSVVSGSYSLTVPATIDKGSFNHICVTLNRDTGVHYLEFFKNATSVATTKSRYTIGSMDIDASDMIIGSGTVVELGGSTITPSQTLSGTLDEFRIFHSARTVEQQAQYAARPVFNTPELRLYYRFNEPPPPLALSSTDQVNSIVIDSSGNALHSLINNFSSFNQVDSDGNITGSHLRVDASTDPTNLVIYEKEETVPVIFPAHPDVIDLNAELLQSATLYDNANPNLITRLIPQHFLLEGSAFDGFEQIEGLGGQAYAGDGIPGQGQLGNVQLLLSMLYVWARFFDEMKLYIDSFSTLRTVDYDTNVSMPNNFLNDLVRQFGFHLPPMFNDSTLEQYVRAENIDQEIGTSPAPLRTVQNELLRRVLINLPDVLRSKGTQHSIKAFLRAVGIDPDNSVRIREYGGPTKRQLSFVRESKREINTMVEFTTASLVISPFLSASRIEPGRPTAAGTFVMSDAFPPNGVSNNINDGLLTSGSWSIEALVKYTPRSIAAMSSATQSLMRLCTTGTLGGGVGLVANLLAVSSSIDPKLVLYIRPGSAPTSPTLVLSMSMPSDAIFGGDKWSVSFGCERNDSIGSRVSSSYFLRLGNQNNGDVETLLTTSSFFYELNGTSVNVLRQLTSSMNASGTYLAVGPAQVIGSGTGTNYALLNDSTIDSESRQVDFTGMLSHLRFWSRAVTNDEWREHVKNYRSTGVQDPLTNYNYVKAASGSFERLRIDSLGKQETKRANSTASLGPLGSITFLDFSQNGLHMTGSGFDIERDCLRSDVFDSSYLSPYFDEASTNEKVRVRGFLDQDLVDQTPWSSVAPAYEILKSEEPTDDVRFAIEFSLVDALNRDIITLFSTLETFDNAVGAPELAFSHDYPTLENIRNVYFNRLSEKLNFKSFFEFFRWFDTSIGTFISQLIPRKTKFKGTNFVIESHMLERHKVEYHSSNMYLQPTDKIRVKEVLLQQIDGAARKF